VTSYDLERHRRAQTRSPTDTFRNDDAGPRALASPRAARAAANAIIVAMTAALDRVHAAWAMFSRSPDTPAAPGCLEPRGAPTCVAGARAAATSGWSAHRRAWGQAGARSASVTVASVPPRQEAGPGSAPALSGPAMLPHPIDAGDRAAAGPDLDHLDHRHAHRQPFPTFRWRARPRTAPHQAAVVRQSSRWCHVERHHAVERPLAGDQDEQRAAGVPDSTTAPETGPRSRAW
jgi:hypothetical protein